MNVKKVKVKSKKKLKEIDNTFKEIENNVEDIIDSSLNQSQIKLKLQKLEKQIENIYITCIKENMNHNTNNDLTPELEYFLQKNILRVFVDYCCFKNLELIKIIVPVIERIIKECKNEIFLMNTGIITSIKVLIVALISIVKQSFNECIQNVSIDQSEIGNFVEIIISFTHALLNKVIIYPNFYSSISVSEEKGKNFDTVVFDLVVELFSKEYLITNREIKSKIRKSILLCLNLENFYSEMNIKDIDTLIHGLIKNLTEYYENFKNTDSLIYSSHFKELLKNEKFTKDVLEKIIILDLKSFLKFISIIIYCFSENKFKIFITKIFFQSFLIECMQKDLLNNTKPLKLFEFIYYLTSIIKNKEISEKIFEFFFGLSINNESLIKMENNNYDEEDDEIIEIKKSIIDGLAENEEFDNYIVEMIEKKNQFSTEKINQKIVNTNNSPNLIEAIKNEIDKLDKENHKYEDIIAFLVKTIESNQTDLKILIINCINNIFHNSSKLFLTEIILPYYKCSMQPINYNEITVQNLINSFERIDIVEIVKQAQPNTINLNFDKWSQYFDLILEKVYKKNLFMINHLSQKSENDFKFIDVTNHSFIKIKINPTNVDEKNSVSTISDANNFSNEIKFKDVRTNFYEVLVKSFKNFINNRYEENLFITKLFLTIFTIPCVAIINETDFNLYNNINFSSNKKANYNFLSSISLINHVWSKIKEEIRINKFEKSVVSKWVSDRYKEKELLQELENMNKLNDKKQQKNVKKADNLKFEFIDNIILFVEFYKEYIANIYIKCQFDFTSRNYLKLFCK